MLADSKHLFVADSGHHRVLECTHDGRVLRQFGYTDGRRCGQATLCPAFSLPDLFAGQQQPTQAEARALLDAVPAYFSQAVITADRSAATLAFGIRLMPLERQ